MKLYTIIAKINSNGRAKFIKYKNVIDLIKVWNYLCRKHDNVYFMNIYSHETKEYIVTWSKATAKSRQL